MDNHATSWAAAALLLSIGYVGGALSALLLAALVRALRRASREEDIPWL